MESSKSTSKQNFSEVVSSNVLANNELANLKKIADIDNCVEQVFGDLVICSPNESHIREIAELWANLASMQQMAAPMRYNFSERKQEWLTFVRNKLAKKNNLLLVAHMKNDTEVRGFLYLQTVVIPSSDLVLKGIIEDIYTKPQYRKQEIALKMLNVSIEWALKHNIKHIDLISLTNTSTLSSLCSKATAQQKESVNLNLLTV